MGAPWGTRHSAASPAGLGLALNFQPSLIMLGLYFDRRRPLANGLAAAGSPVFLSALSPLGQQLLVHFGWRGGFLLLGGLLLHCCACGAVMRPPPGSGPRPLRDSAGDAPEEAEADRAGLSLSEAPPGGRTRRRLLDVTVCADRAFAVYAVTKFLMALGLFVPAILLVNYAKDAGVPDADAAFLLSIVGFVDIVARPACGALAGLPRLRPHVAYLFSLALLANGLTDLSSARARSYGTLVAFCIAFGLSYGMVGALQFEVLMATVGAHRFPSALGLVLLIEAVAVLIGPPSAGAPRRRRGWPRLMPLSPREVPFLSQMELTGMREKDSSVETATGGGLPFPWPINPSTKPVPPALGGNGEARKGARKNPTLTAAGPLGHLQRLAQRPCEVQILLQMRKLRHGGLVQVAVLKSERSPAQC